jgi:hypothetical protein
MLPCCTRNYKLIPFGLSPYWLLPGVESWHANTINTILTNGISESKYNQPDLSVSCRRRTVTATLGAIMPVAKIVVKMRLFFIIISRVSVKVGYYSEKIEDRIFSLTVILHI